MSPNVDVKLAVTLLDEQFGEAEDEDDSPKLQFREFTTADGELVKRTIAMQLRDGAIGRLNAVSPPDYSGLAKAVFNRAEIPVKSSPLKGITLST